MKKFIHDRPWLFIVALLALFVTANVSVFIAAQRSHGPDLLQVDAAPLAAER